MIKVIIADDSLLTRTVLKDLLSNDPEIKIIAEVEDGRQAVNETARLRPDLVIMDIMMPVMDGLDAVTEIMADCPTPILVLSANVDSQDSRSAFRAIELGALDVMEKPKGAATDAFAAIAEHLRAKVKTLARIRVIHHYRRELKSVRKRLVSDLTVKRRLLAIAASTGGPKAIMHLLKNTKQNNIPVLIVQHIAKGFAAGFAEWLDRECPWKVMLAEDGMGLANGVALVAPCGQHLEIHGGRVRLSDKPLVNSCRPSADIMFQSLANEGMAPHTLAVLLTGMGTDGADGLTTLREAGSYNVVQDEKSSAVFGMPRAAIERNAADLILPLNEIPAALGKILSS